jgi:hypothetical protein
MNTLSLLPGFDPSDDREVATIDSRMDTSTLPVNDYTKIGHGINRWQFLFFDPQTNSIEPFLRLGQNTVLPVLDRQANECFRTYQTQGAIQGEVYAANR